MPWEVLPNAVDVELFTPAERPPEGGPVLLLGGDQTQAYRLELALRTLAALLPAQPAARLLVTGRLESPIEPLVEGLGLREHVSVLGEYAQRDAPEIFRRAHVLLHTKVKDPCPTLVLEAMASGLPVVYPASGGTPELVGEEAGVGVAHPDTWERDEPPAPEELAAAVERRALQTCLATQPPRARAPSSGSPSSRGSTVTPSSSRSSSGSPSRGREVSRRGVPHEQGRGGGARRRRPPAAG